MTVRHLARNNINYMEYLLSRTRFKQKPFVPIEIRKGHYIINIPLKDTIIGHVNGKRNLLTYSFWKETLGIEATANCSQIYNPIFGGYSSPTGSAYIEYGYGTQACFSQNTLQNQAGSISTQVSIGTLSDRVRITLYGVLPENINPPTQIAPYIPLNDGYNGLGVWSGSFSPGTAVTYYIDVLQPWVQNYAYIIYSWMTGLSGVPVVSTSGSSFGTTACEANGGSIMIGSVNSYSWSPAITSITQDVTFGTSHNFQNNGTSVVDYITGNATPSETIQIQTLGLIQRYYNGSTYVPILILVLPLSSPITLYANQINSVSLRLVAEGNC